MATGASTRSPSSGSSGRKSIKPIQKTDGRGWDKEVVRALCQRLPGGRASVTTVCTVCESKFYPCLCHNRIHEKHTRILRPPRIVRIAERMRLGKPINKGKDSSEIAGIKGWGNLRQVMSLADQPGMDKTRALVSGFDDPMSEKICECGHQMHYNHTKCRFCGKDAEECQPAERTKGKIIWRKENRYLIRPDATRPWEQTIDLSFDNLKVLLTIMNGECRIVKRIPHGNKQREHDVKSYNAFTAIVDYKTVGEAKGDMELSPLQHGYFCVQALRHGGPAYKAGVRGGHVLLLLQCAETSKVLSKEKTVYRSLDAHQYLPVVLRPPQECFQMNEEDDENLDWPLRLVFDRLPQEWTLVGIERDASGPAPDLPGIIEDDAVDSHGAKPPGDAAVDPINFQELADLIEQQGKEPDETKKGARLRFERETQVVVMRSHMALRHEHRWEHKVKPSRKDDYNMLVDWGLSSRLTPAQLSYAFNRMAEALKDELSEFEKMEGKYQSLLLGKARKCVEIGNEMEHRQRKDPLKSVESLEKGRNIYLNEIQALCHQVPIHFLLKMKIACRDPDQDTDEEELDADLGQFGAQPSFGTVLSVMGSDAGDTPNSKSSSFGSSSFKNSRDRTGVAIDNPQGVTDNGRKALMSPQSRTSARRASTFGALRARSNLKEDVPSLEDASTRLRDKLARELHDKLAHKHNVISTSDMAERTRVAAVNEDAVLNLIGEQIGIYLDSVKNESKAKAKNGPSLGGRRAGNAQQQELSSAAPASRKPQRLADSSSSRDGRLTFSEFQHVLFDAGITWLNGEEMRKKFVALDFDQSGRLNLAEVLSAAARMQELVEQAREFEKDQMKAGRKMTQVELMEEFARELLTGKDLTSEDRGAKFSASSGATTYTWAHVDVEESAWIAEDSDREKFNRWGRDWKQYMEDGSGNPSYSPVWVEWDFGRPCLLMSVSTRGHFRSDSWVKTYTLRYQVANNGNSGQEAEHGEEVAQPEDDGWICVYGEHDEDDESLDKKGDLYPKVFSGNVDCDTPVHNILPEQIENVVKVRLYIESYQGSYGDPPAIRSAFYGCHYGDEKEKDGNGEVPEPSRKPAVSAWADDPQPNGGYAPSRPDPTRHAKGWKSNTFEENKDLRSPSPRPPSK